MEMNAISSINFNARTSRKKRPKIMLNKTNISKMTDDEKHSWVAGFVIGSALSAAVLGGGTSLYNNYEKKDLLNEFKEEYKQDDTKGLKIEDINEDGVPEIILEKKDGDAYIYDMNNYAVGIKMGDEIVPEIR